MIKAILKFFKSLFMVLLMAAIAIVVYYVLQVWGGPIGDFLKEIFK